MNFDPTTLNALAVWPIVMDVTERTAAAWEKLAEKDLLPEAMRKAIGDHIMTVAGSVAQASTK